MIEFELDGIRIEIGVEMERHDYKDANCRGRTRFERRVTIYAGFWNFPVRGNMQELSYIIASLTYFMLGYWRRPGNDGGRIDLVKKIERNSECEDNRILYFVARQKNKRNFLQICLEENGVITNQVYLDGQEVLMLDLAIGKAIHLLTPTSGQRDSGYY